MTDEPRSHTKLFVALGIVVAAIIVGRIIAWDASINEHIAHGRQSKVFAVNCQFDRIRQIMVRKDATEAIVGHSGMTLLDERVEGNSIRRAAA